MQSAPGIVQKACLIPVCQGRKFQLVHKFPSDKERFAEWVEAIQKDQKVKQLSGDLNDEQIRKRYFICSRHFGLNQYKNIESRSLNITALPHLNLVDLDKLQESKAYRVEDQPDPIVDEDMLKNQKSSPAKCAQQTVRILNSEIVKTDNKLGNEIVRVPKRPASAAKPQTNEHVFKEPRAKKVKVFNNSLMILKQKSYEIKSKEIQIEPIVEKLEMPPETENIEPVAEDEIVEEPVKPTLKRVSTQKKSPPKKKESPKSKQATQKLQNGEEKSEKPEKTEEEPSPPANKLLALVEVTPEQYEKLSKSLSSAQRNEQISSLLNFIDKEDTELESADNEISVELNGEDCKFDLFWLRDHCRCNFCYDHSNHQRKINILDIPDDVKAEKFDVDGNKLRIMWIDKHESSYDLDFLLKNHPGSSRKPSEITLWNCDLISDPLKTSCRVTMRDYMTDPAVSKKVLESLHTYGVAFIDGVQPTERNTEFVIRELFPVHKTLFGEMWTFSDAKDHSDTAYTNIYLGPHNDNTYFNDAAGLQILHCIQHSGDGGENFLIDGFQVAQRVKENDPDVFERLTSTNVTAEYIEDGRHHSHSAPIISLDAVTDEISQIRFNLYDRAPLKNIAADKIRQFYGDLKVLAREFENHDNRITFKLQPGTVMIFDNWRVLHGRLAYSGKRTMTGCYVARTEYQSALRVNKFIE